MYRILEAEVDGIKGLYGMRRIYGNISTMRFHWLQIIMLRSYYFSQPTSAHSPLFPIYPENFSGCTSSAEITDFRIPEDT